MITFLCDVLYFEAFLPEVPPKQSGSTYEAKMYEHFPAKIPLLYNPKYISKFKFFVESPLKR